MLTKFLNRVLPSMGHWFVVHISQDGRTNAVPVDAGDTATVQSLIHRGNNSKQNTYYGVCSFVGSETVPLKRNRACATAGAFRTLRIDIDCGDGKDYQTFDDAVDAVDEFVETAGLPSPLLVSSGRGLHVYFPFGGRDIPFAEWHQLASRLRAAALQHGLKFDDNITEAERLLRLPTSINQRSGQECTIFDEGEDSSPEFLAQVLSRFDAPDTTIMALAGKPPAALAGDELESGLLQAYSARLAIETCPAFAAIKDTGGAGVTEPLWKGMLDTIVGGNDPDEDKWLLAQEISQGHATYSEEGLKRKLLQSYTQRYSPPTCARVNRPECSTCPFSSRVKSPATLGVPGLVVANVPEQALVAPPPAPTAATPQSGQAAQQTASNHEVVFDGVDVRFGSNGQFVVSSGKMMVSTKEGEGYVWKPIATDFRFHRAHFQASRTAADYSLVAYFHVIDDRTGGVRNTIRVEIATEHMVGKDTFNKAIWGQRLTVQQRDIEKFKEMLMGFVNFLQGRGIERTKFDAIGWDGDAQFVFGDAVLTQSGQLVHHEHPVGPTMNVDGANLPVFQPSGDEALQIDALNQMLISVPAHLVLALSIATPLVRYTAFNGAMVSMYSKESGVGKTALLKAITSIWGAPTHAIIPASSTPAAIQHLIGQARSVPVAIDEVSAFSDHAIQELLYGVSQGQGKRRMGKGGESIQAQQAEWQTLLFVTTNIAVAERARNVMPDSSATLARLLEIRMPPLPKDVTLGSPDVVLQRNYGFVGRKVAGYMMQFSAEQWRENIAKRVVTWGAKLGTNAVHGDDRFRVALCALAELGAVFGQALGIQLDVAKVEQGVKDVCDSMRRDAEALLVTEEKILNRYIFDNGPRIARLRLVNGVLQQPDDNDIRDGTFGEIVLTPNGKGQLVAHSCHLPVHKLLAYAKEQKFNVTAFRDWLHNSPYSRHVGRVTLMAGTKSAVPVDAVRINTSILGAASLSSLGSAVDDEAAAG